MGKILLHMLGMLMLCTQLFAQSRTISGRITDAQGNAIANASVLIKGTTVGTTTANDGSFSLTLPPNAGALVISSIGFADQEISLKNRTNFSISLSNSDQSMNEVVVVAYGTQRRGAAIGSIAQVNAKDFENRPITNALNALVGAAPGIQTTTPSGAPGSSPGIIVRGFGSYSLSSAPLYVVDGVIFWECD